MNNIKPIFEHTNRQMNIAVFISGSGTNLKALCEKQGELQEKGEKQFGKVRVVFTNIPGCKGTEIAEQYNIPVVSLSSKRFSETLGLSPDNEELRRYYDAAAISLIESVCKPDLLVLAGYRRKLSSLFNENYRNKIINLYPGDITKKYLLTGIQAPIQAIRNGEDCIKATVYLEQENTRFGIPILQSDTVSLKGFTEDDIEIINKSIREQAEWVIFPYAVYGLIAEGRLGIDDESRLYLDNELIGESGLQSKEIKEQKIS